MVSEEMPTEETLACLDREIPNWREMPRDELRAALMVIMDGLLDAYNIVSKREENV